MVVRCNFLLYVFSILGLCSCSHDPSIHAVCEKDANGDYVIKWELYPDEQNVSMEIYASDNDSVFPSSPIRIVQSSDYIAIITDSLHFADRMYFQLRIGGVKSGIISNSYFKLSGVQNFRDMGGYNTTANRHVRWGKLFRSGTLAFMTAPDTVELGKLNIKTVIDIRSADAGAKYANHLHSPCYIRIPIVDRGAETIQDQLQTDSFRRENAINYNQVVYRDMVECYAEDFAIFFDYLCDESNYPIVYHCYLGKDQTGLASYFLLLALGVSNGDAESDFMESNQGIDKSKLLAGADQLTESGQEALTTLIKADISFLRQSVSYMRAKSGSVDEYMTNELRLTPEKREKLQNILLY